MDLSYEEALAMAREDFAHAELGDARNTRRLVKMAAQALLTPGGTITSVFSEKSEREAAYDFVENDRISPAALAEAIGIAAARRCAHLPFVYAATDGTSQTLSDEKQVKGTGRVGSDDMGLRGDQTHDAIFIDPLGVPLGLAGLLSWQRGEKATASERHKKPTEEKETRYWMESRLTVRTLLARYAPGVIPHFLHDRGADAWPVILDAVSEAVLARGTEYTTLRANHNRRLLEVDGEAVSGPDEMPTYLRGALACAARMGEFYLDVPGRKGQRGKKARKARRAKMHVLACSVTLDLLDRRTDKKMSAELWAVCAREVETPPGEESIEWLLLTTYPVLGWEDAQLVLRGYTYRWRIEEFHNAWKSGGTDVEATQLFDADHRQRWGLILAAVAIRLLRWTYLAKVTPEIAAEEEFSTEVVEAVRDLQPEAIVPEVGAATVGQVVVALGRIGGFVGRKGTLPGLRTLARGWKRVAAHIAGMRGHRKRKMLRIPELLEDQ